MLSFLDAVKVVALPLELDEGHKGTIALQCCAAAGAQLAAAGEVWSASGVVTAYAAVKGCSAPSVWSSMKRVMRKAGLEGVPPSALIYFLGETAGRVAHDVNKQTRRQKR